MLSYKSQPVIEDGEGLGYIGKIDATMPKAVPGVTDLEGNPKMSEVTVYIIGFNVWGAVIQWHFDDEAERDWAFDCVIKEIKHKITRLDNFTNPKAKAALEVLH